MAGTSQPTATNPSPSGGALPAVEASTLDSKYINFCRVTGMPEEVIIDFGLSTDPAEMSAGSMIATERVVMSFYTSKRLLEALQVTVARHETAFGPLELSAQKRFRPGGQG
ncbi:MAG TPA: DUF3467 domain-containing protein [Pirellulales bacterium]|jgi:hypothetical protein